MPTTTGENGGGGEGGTREQRGEATGAPGVAWGAEEMRGGGAAGYGDTATAAERERNINNGTLLGTGEGAGLAAITPAGTNAATLAVMGLNVNGTPQTGLRQANLFAGAPAMGTGYGGEVGARGATRQQQQQRGEQGQQQQGGEKEKNTLLKVLKAQMEANRGNEARTRSQFTWQKAKGSGEAEKEIKERILAGSQRVAAYAYVGEDSPVVKIVWGIRNYYGLEGPAEVQGKIVGIQGDRSDFGRPFPVVLPKKNTWKWEKVNMIKDEVAWATWAAQNEVTGFWEPTGQRQQEELPRLLALPDEVAHFLMSGRKTAREAFMFVNELPGREGAVVTEEEVQFLKLWFMAAGQAAAGTRQSALVLKVATAPQDDREFMLWHQSMVMAALGPEEERRQEVVGGSPQGTVGGAMGGGNDVTAQALSQISQLLTRQQTSIEGAAGLAKKSSNTRDPYTAFQYAKLMGYAGVQNVRDLPAFWRQALTSKNPDDHRNMLMGQMKRWALEFAKGQADPTRGLYLAKEQMKDIVEVKFGSGAPFALLKTAENGLTNIGLLQRSYRDIMDIKKYEANEELTKSTRNLKELEKRANMFKREPPKYYEELLNNVAGLLAFLWAMFGENCPAYVQGMHLFQVLSCDYVHANKGKFDPEFCRKVTWAIHEAMEEFYAQELTPEDFNPDNGPTQYPTCCLEVLGEPLKYVQEIYRPTYPEEWVLVDKLEQKQAGGYSTGGENAGRQFGGKGGGTGRGAGGGRGWGAYEGRGGGNAGRGYGGSTGGGTSGGGSRAFKPAVKAQMEQVHGDIKKIMKPYWDKFGQDHLFGELLKAGGVEYDKLPYMTSLVSESGQNKLCYNYLLGLCRWVGGGKPCKFEHVEGKELDESMVKELVQCITPGVQWYCSQAPPQPGSWQRVGADRGSSYGGRGRGGGPGGSPHFKKQRTN